jgi:hypothetical protein
MMHLPLLLPVMLVASRSPFNWGTVQDLSYTFCYNASGPYNADALRQLAKSKLFIHGMNERQEQAPAFLQSEEKVIASAQQMLAVNPAQQQFYTIQNDFTRAIYDSGAWFNSHPECLLRDKDGELVNHTATNQKYPICTAGPNKTDCHVYGFQTQCGRDAWVKFAVDTVTKGKLSGVFIDGFQGCAPEGGCGRTLVTCSAEQSKSWLAGLGDALWELHRQLKALGGNKTIICNGTGQMYACGGKKPCYCDAANKERFYPNANDLEQVVAAAAEDNMHGSSAASFWGIIHVPHIDDGDVNFNKSLAGFLATAGAPAVAFGYGVGFEYDCDEGGWLVDHPELSQPLGPPAGPPIVTHANHSRGNQHAVFTRGYTSGVRVYYNATAHPSHSASCVRWVDGSSTEANGGCGQMERWLLLTEGETA